MILQEEGLENTPNVFGMNADVSLYEQLLTFVQEHVEDIDKGAYLLPKHLLAKEVISYSTMGINRIANRPFSVIRSQSGDLLTDIKQQWSSLQKDKDLQWVNSADSLIDRLNNGSCQGVSSSKFDCWISFWERKMKRSMALPIVYKSRFHHTFWKIKKTSKIFSTTRIRTRHRYLSSTLSLSEYHTSSE